MRPYLLTIGGVLLGSSFFLGQILDPSVFPLTEFGQNILSWLSTVVTGTIGTMAVIRGIFTGSEGGKNLLGLFGGLVK